MSTTKLKTPEEYGYVYKNNILAFQKGPLSQWWGSFKDQSADIHVFDLSVMIGDIITLAVDPSAEMWKRGHNKFTFNCCEQWMMACKAFAFSDIETFDLIIAEKNAANHKALGRQIKNFDSSVWDLLKYKIVSYGNSLKFAQNPDLLEFLRQFHRQTIFVEAAPWDKIWGNGLSPEDPKCFDLRFWQGENLLGQAIGEVRREF
jgi:ribA/ribD-fused uncharacterized protein